MKKLSLLAAALVLASSGAHAAQQSSQFNVVMTFSSLCSVSVGATAINVTYAPFQAGAATGSTSATFQCSRGLAPTFSFDDSGAGSAQTGGAAQLVGTAFTGEGVLKGIRYTLTGGVTKTAGTAASAGSGATAGSDGTADSYAVNVNLNANPNQAGDPAGSNSQTRTIYINY